MTLSSPSAPPGWAMAAAPAAAAASTASGKGKKASEAHTPPRARSPALRAAISVECDPGLLAGADAEGLAVLGQHDGVGAGGGAHLPGELQVGPLRLGGPVRVTTFQVERSAS